MFLQTNLSDLHISIVYWYKKIEDRKIAIDKDNKNKIPFTLISFSWTFNGVFLII